MNRRESAQGPPVDENRGDTSPPDRAEVLHYAAIVAHQLQSPLSAVGAALSTLLTGYVGELTPRQRDLLFRAAERCDEAGTALRRMLELARPARPEDREETTDLAAIVRRMETSFSEKARAARIEVSVEVGEAPLFAQMREAAFTEMLQALVENAIKYTPEHGRVRLRLRREGGEALVSVSDSGIGVPEDMREKIFEPFTRAASARASSRPGVGLGLAFARSLVERAGGSIAVGRSDMGGADFTVRLSAAAAPSNARDGGAGPPRPRVVVIGGVTAGPKVVAKVHRLDPSAEITLVERGQVLAYAGCGLPYFISGAVSDHRRLISTPAGALRESVLFQNLPNVRVFNRTEALRLDRQNRRVLVRRLDTRDEFWLDYTTLVLATGSRSLVPDLPGVRLGNIFTLHGVEDAEGIRAAVGEGRAKDVVIVGGGLLGVEVTEALARCGCRVTLIEAGRQVLPLLDWEMARLVEQHLESNGVRVLTGCRPTAFRGEKKVSCVETDAGPVPTEMVILGVGVQPNVALAAEAGLPIGETGAIVVDETLRTADPDIYAVGDCAECRDRLTGRPARVGLGSTANKQARAAAINLCGGREAFPGILRSVVCKIFDYCVARTGLTESEARAAGREVVVACVPGPDRAHFMPNARLLMLKSVVDARSRRLLGVQAVGPGEGHKRVDMAAFAIAAGLTVDQIANIDTCYAPPYSPILDNLATAANVARNKLDGLFTGISAVEVKRRLAAGEDLLLLDVRTPAEHEQERLPGARHVPLGALRGRLHELPRDRDIVTFCDSSLRGYEAAVILRAAGFPRVKVLDGGLLMWPFEKVS